MGGLWCLFCLFGLWVWFVSLFVLFVFVYFGFGWVGHVMLLVWICLCVVILGLFWVAAVFVGCEFSVLLAVYVVWSLTGCFVLWFV